MIRFDDGVNVKTDGPMRVLRLRDGWYVVGQGMLIPCVDRQEARELVAAYKEFPDR